MTDITARPDLGEEYALLVDAEERVLAAEMEAVRLRRFLAAQGWTEKLTPICCIQGGTDISGCSCVNPQHELLWHNVGSEKANAALPEHQRTRPDALAGKLAEALGAMVEEKADYMRLNHLGDPEQQHTVKQARAALAEWEAGRA